MKRTLTSALVAVSFMAVTIAGTTTSASAESTGTGGGATQTGLAQLKKTLGQSLGGTSASSRKLSDTIKKVLEQASQIGKERV
jgi:hypothetical protein